MMKYIILLSLAVSCLASYQHERRYDVAMKRGKGMV